MTIARRIGLASVLTLAFASAVAGTGQAASAASSQTTTKCTWSRSHHRGTRTCRFYRNHRLVEKCVRKPGHRQKCRTYPAPMPTAPPPAATPTPPAAPPPPPSSGTPPPTVTSTPQTAVTDNDNDGDGITLTSIIGDYNSIATGVQSPVPQDYDHDPIANPAKVNPAFSRTLTGGITSVVIGGETDSSLVALEGVPPETVTVSGYTNASLTQLEMLCLDFIPAETLVYADAVSYIYQHPYGEYNPGNGYCYEYFTYAGVEYVWSQYVANFIAPDFAALEQIYSLVPQQFWPEAFL